MLSRRQFGLLGSAGLLAPRTLLAGPADDQHCFLFIYCDGGWDTTRVFTPMFDSSAFSMEDDASPAMVGGIEFVDSPRRPSVRNFLAGWAGQTAFLNGLEVQSITHERCRQLILTGSTESADDWPSILGAHGSDSLLMPHVILDGIAYTDQYTNKVIRLGDEGQLTDLLSGRALSLSSQEITAPSPNADSLEDLFLRERLSSLSEASALPGNFVEDYSRVAEHHERLLAYTDSLDLSSPQLGCERNLRLDCMTAFDCFEFGISRCAMVRYKGWCSEGWDTHQNLALQSLNFEDLFFYLHDILDDLNRRMGLAKRVTVVVFSEMGRAPPLNSWGGKDHWTVTSVMLTGAGIAGERVIGGLDDQGIGHPIDLSSGESTENGTVLTPSHLGATLLALGDVDPGPYVSDTPPISALLS